MITNFEDLTEELTPDEIIAGKYVATVIKNRKGKAKAIKNPEIAATVEILLQEYEEVKIKLSPVRIRKIIHAIRVSGLVPLLCSSSNGYYVARTKEEADKMITSLSERCNSINTVRDAIKKQYAERYSGNQQTLF